MSSLGKTSSVFITGGAMNSCMGQTLAQAVAALKKPPAPVDSVTTEVTGNDNIEEESIPYRLLSPKDLSEMETRSYAVIDSVVDQAIRDAGLNADELAHTALFCGSSSFLIGDKEQSYKNEIATGQVELVPLRASGFGAITAHLSDKFSIGGEVFNFNTACTASANALLYAARMLNAGLIEHAIVFGVEFFNETTMLGFNNLELLSRTAMRPFDKRRNGLELGEACAAVVLSRDTRGKKNIFRLCGGANLCDTYSISAANPDGSTVYKVMNMAVESAEILRKDILAVKCHGTASLLNDETESAGMHAFFDVLPLVCVLKPYLGHTLGACGLSELLLFCASVQAGFVPAVVSGFQQDDELQIALNEKFEDPGKGYYMLNYFGFGGNNTSLVLGNV